MGWIRTFLGLMWGLSFPAWANPEVIAEAPITDPFFGMSVEELDNGMKIVLEPTYPHQQTRVELRFFLEGISEIRNSPALVGIAKHFLLRDEWGQTRREIFDEAGGDLETRSSSELIAFSSVLPAVKGTWAINELAKILATRRVDFETLETAKEAFERETSLATRRSGEWLRDMSFSFRPPSLYESEFGVRDPAADRHHMRQSLREISVAKLQTFLDRHVRPQNAVLYLSGPFKRAETLNFVSETYGRFTGGATEAVNLMSPRLRRLPFVRARRAAVLPRIEIGTKLWNLDPEDEMVTRAFLKYLAGWTHSQLQPAEAKVDTDLRIESGRYGLAAIKFDIAPDQYEHALHTLQLTLEPRRLETALTPELIERITEDYLIKLQSDPLTSGEGFYAFQSRHHTGLTPFEVMEAITPGDFRRRLVRVFRSDMQFLQTWGPPIFFDDELWLLHLLSAGLMLFALRKLLRSGFDHAHLRYVRKIRFSPLSQFVLILSFLGILGSLSQATALLDRLLYSSTTYQSTFLLNTYLRGCLFAACGVGAAIGFLCLIPRKMMIVGDTIIFKSLSYASHRYPLAMLKDITICRPWQVLQLRRGLGRLRWLNGSLWNKGLLIRFTDRSSYYVSFRDTDKVARELSDVLSNEAAHAYRKSA